MWNVFVHKRKFYLVQASSKPNFSKFLYNSHPDPISKSCLCKQLLNSFLLSRNEQDTSHKMYMCHLLLLSITKTDRVYCPKHWVLKYILIIPPPCKPSSLKYNFIVLSYIVCLISSMILGTRLLPHEFSSDESLQSCTRLQSCDCL